MRGTSAIEYDERVLDVGKDGQIRKTARLCRRTDFRRTVGDRPQENSLRPEVRRLILLRHQNKEVPFSPDGPLMWGEIDLIRTDVFTPALTGLLADHPVRLGDRWSATQSAIQELTDLERIEEGSLECRLEQFTTVEKRRHARVSFRGSVRGTNEDGPNRQQLEGYFFFDLESNHLSYLFVQGKHFLLDKDGKEVGRVEGRFVLTRQAHTRCAELSESALQGVVVEPNDDNTLLLYDNPDLGVRFRYGRRWHVAGVRGSQVALDGADGSGLLLTLDPLTRDSDRRALPGRIARVAGQAERPSAARRSAADGAAVADPRTLRLGGGDGRTEVHDGLLRHAAEPRRRYHRRPSVAAQTCPPCKRKWNALPSAWSSPANRRRSEPIRGAGGERPRRRRDRRPSNHFDQVGR